MTKEIWQQKSDEELTTASEHLSGYTTEAEEIIRAELQRRSMPEPEPTVRTEGQEPSKKPSRFGLILIVVLIAVGIGAIWLYLSQSKIDASEIDDMSSSISVKAKEYADKGNTSGFEYYAFVMRRLALEKKLILTSPAERSQKDLDVIYEAIHHSDYDKTLRQELSATQYQALQRLRKDYEYVKD